MASEQQSIGDPSLPPDHVSLPNHYSQTRDLLIRLGVLGNEQELPPLGPPLTGVAGKSAVYSVSIPNQDNSALHLIVKFDLPERFEKEKAALRLLMKRSTPPELLLPYGKQMGLGMMDTALVYDNASGSGSEKIFALGDYLVQMLKTNPEACLQAMEKLFLALRPLWKHSGSEKKQWKEYFDKVVEGQGEIRRDAGLLGLNLDPALAELEGDTGSLHLGWIHGDPNYSNFLVGTNTQGQVERVMVIDLAESKVAPVVLDLARLETELWQEVAPLICKNDLVAQYRVGRDWLESRSQKSPKDPLVQRLFDLTACIRNEAFSGKYLIQKDQYHAVLCLTHLRGSLFQTVREKPVKTKIALQGALASATFLSDWRIGKYIGGSSNFSTPEPKQPDPAAIKTTPQNEENSIFALVVSKVSTILTEIEPLRSMLCGEGRATPDDLARELAQGPLTRSITRIISGFDNLAKRTSKNKIEWPPLFREGDNIIGWLVLLSVDNEWAEKNKDLLSRQPPRLDLRLNAKSPFGAAAVLARLHKNQAQLCSGRSETTVHGRHGFSLPRLLEPGIGSAVFVDEIKRQLWSRFLPAEDVPDHFGEDQNGSLNQQFVLLLHVEKQAPFVPVDSKSSDHPLNNQEILVALTADLPDLNIVFLEPGEGAQLIVQEIELARTIRFYFNEQNKILGKE